MKLARSTFVVALAVVALGPIWRDDRQLAHRGPGDSIYAESSGS